MTTLEGQDVPQNQTTNQVEQDAEVADQGGSSATATENGGIQGFLNQMYGQNGSNGNLERSVPNTGGATTHAERPADGMLSGALDNTGNRPEIGEKLHNQLKKFGPKDTEPTAEERKQAVDRATKALEANPLFKLLSPEDRATALKMQEAVLNGDTKALGELVKGLAGDPAKMEALSKAIGENLSKLGSNTRLEMGPDGSLLVFRDCDTRAVQVGKDGSSKVVAIDQHNGGLDILNDRTVVRPTASELLKQVGDSAVNRTNWNSQFMRSIPWENIPRSVPNPPVIIRPGHGGIGIPKDLQGN